jgi:SAM-dependent methyltransferase
MSSHPEPLRSTTVFGETESGARNLPRFLCSLLQPGSVLVLGASDVALQACARHEVTVVDWSHARLAHLGERAREQGREIRLHCRNPAREDLGLSPRSFRNVICLDVLERFPNDVAVLEKLHRLLPAEGRLVVRVPARPWSGDGAAGDAGARRYDPESLRSALEEASFRTLRLRHWNVVGVPAALREKGPAERAPRGGDRGSRPAWWDSTVDLWFRAIEKRVAFPVGVSLVAVATPHVERARVQRPARNRALTGRAHREAYEPMAASR